jgi:hypothetical protein
VPMIYAAIITALVIVISAFLEFFFSFFQIIFKKPIPPKGAVEIDRVERIYAHPDYTRSLQDPDSFDAKTVYEVLRRGLKISPNRPQFSYRFSSNEPFKSYTYKSVSFVFSFVLIFRLLAAKCSKSHERSPVVSFIQVSQLRTRPTSAFIVRRQ